MPKTMRETARRLLALSATAVLPLLAAACSTTGDYPSLALRDFERNGVAVPDAPTPAPSPTPLPVNADLATRLEALLARAQEAHARFESARPAAQRAVAGAGSQTSDSWSRAQIAVASLETSRSQAVGALADIDMLYLEARDASPIDESSDTRAIDEVRQQIIAWVAGQDELLAGLASRLSS